MLLFAQYQFIIVISKAGYVFSVSQGDKKSSAGKKKK